MAAMIAAAERPLVILGGGDWNAQACADIESFSTAFQLPVATAFRRQDLIDNRHANFAGDMGIGINPKLAQRVRDSDLLVAIGPRLGETTTSGYTLIGVPRPKQKLIHVHADPDELGRVYHADFMIVSGMPEFASAVRAAKAPESCAWGDWVRSAYADYLQTLEHGAMPGQ